MPDASRARRHDDFAETMQFPPDVPCPTGPLAGFRVVLDKTMKPDEIRFVQPGERGYSDVPVPMPRLKIERQVEEWPVPPPVSPIAYPDPEAIAKERAKRQRQERQAERIEDMRHAQWTELVKKAEKRGHDAGHNEGHHAGFTSGWWNGLAFGVMVGVSICYFAVKLGWLAGHA